MRSQASGMIDLSTCLMGIFARASRKSAPTTSSASCGAVRIKNVVSIKKKSSKAFNVGVKPVNGRVPAIVLADGNLKRHSNLLA